MFRNLWVMHADSRFVTLTAKRPWRTFFFPLRCCVKYSCICVAHSVGHCGNVTEIHSQVGYYLISESMLIFWSVYGVCTHTHISSVKLGRMSINLFKYGLFRIYKNLVYFLYLASWISPRKFHRILSSVFLPPPTQFPIITRNMSNSREALLLKDALRS